MATRGALHVRRPVLLPPQIRCLHRRITLPPIPPPTPFVPDPQTFLMLIGRNLKTHASKIGSWDALFSLSGQKLRELGVEPARDRRYLLRWRDKFRHGEFGVGGDLQEVVDGVGEVRVAEVPLASSSGSRKVVVNAPPGGDADPGAQPVGRLKVKGAHTIRGPYVQPVKGAQGRVARVIVTEGMWEHRRGHKVDGGERRRAEVKAKRKAEERRNAR
ncbi:MAG: hypothetical protein M1832_004070 [Thelocarpon impressellum]|nr:MAG: hypothetical protein M1832_004070 [Thelocarpon impressellum]